MNIKRSLIIASVLPVTHPKKRPFSDMHAIRNQFSLNGGAANKQTPSSYSGGTNTRCLSLFVAILAGLMAGAFSVPVRAGTVTVDFRQDLDPARVWVGLRSNFQQAKTADGLRIWTDGTGRASDVSISLAGLTTNNARLAGDFIATLTYSGMAGWKNPPYENLNFLRLGTMWGAFGGEDYVVQRTFDHNWVTDLYPERGDRFDCATWIPSNGILNGAWTHYNGINLGGSGTLAIERIGDEVWLYANGELLGHGGVDGSRTVDSFYIAMRQSSSSPIDVTFNSFTLSGPNLASWASPVTLTTNTTLAPGDTTYAGASLIVSNCTLTVDGAHSFDTLLLKNGAVLTHSPVPAGEVNHQLDLTITNDLTVDGTSRIDVDAKGYGPVAGPGAGISSGYYPSGGGHGGPGGNSYEGPAGGESCGDLLAPTLCGSGGGNSTNFGTGGMGGGAIRLAVGGLLTVAGQLTANGESGRPSGGAGGSIQVRAGTLAGNGSIVANGGSAGIAGGGGGGGGRIALYYGNSTFSGALTALGGLASGSPSGKSGGAGTLYTQASSQSVGNLRLDNSGRTNAMETLLTTPVAYRLTLANVTAYATNSLTFAGLRVSAGGLLTHPFQGPRLQVRVQGDAVVESGGAIGADGRGYPAHTGPGSGSTYWDTASGAGHGGQGGSGYYVGPGGLAYDSATEPVDFGSGGGGGTWPNRGGGAIQLTVAGTLTLDGRVSVNADAATGAYDGGGAGGSVWLTASRLNGAGSITANGQVAGYSLSGSGGGGRVAIYTGVNEFAGSVVASGGTSESRPGGNGTVRYGPNVPAGLIAWWRGEGEASDALGVHPGTAQGGVSYPPAQVGAGFAFDSNDDRVNVPSAEDLNPGTGGFTAQFWLRGTKAQPDYLNGLLDKSHGFTDSTGWALSCWTNNGQVSFAIGQGGSGSGNFQEIRSQTDVLDGGFHQVTAVWTGTEAQLFVDGTLEDHHASSPAANNTRPLCLGYVWGGGTPQRCFRGTLDEVMIFNRALTPAEVASLYFNQGGPLVLSLQPASGGVLCSWPASAAGFGLVARTNLTAGSWESVTNSPVLNGDRQEVFLPANPPVQRFFRLAQ